MSGLNKKRNDLTRNKAALEMAHLVKVHAVRLARGSANLKFDDDRIRDLKKLYL